MYEATNDHHVWLPRVKDCRTRIPTLCFASPVTSFTTRELKAQTVLQARLDARWHRDATEPLELTSFKFVEPQEVFSASLLPGGEYIVIIYDTGKISLKRLEIGVSKVSQLIEIDNCNDHLEDGSDPINTVKVEPLYTQELGMLLAVTVDQYTW